MKVNLKTVLLACWVLTLGFVSCHDENGGNENNYTDKGTPTYINLSLNFPQSKASMLRSTGDPNATEAEAKINTVDVFIYATNQGYYLSHTSLTADNFTQTTSGEAGDIYVLNADVKIPTTTGDRQVFVAVNLPADMVAALENKGNSELTQVAKKLTRSLLSSDNGIIMTSATLVNCTFVADPNNPANHPEITVKRMAAKVAVQKGNPMVQTGVPGKLGSLSFAINNFNEWSFLIQGVAPEYKDPNWDNYNPADFSQVDYTESYYKLVNDSLITDPKQLSAWYSAENTSKTHKKKEITRVTIRATFIPDNILVYQGSDYVSVSSAAEGYNTPQTFYTVTLYRPNPEMKCFYDETTARNFAVANGLTVNDVVTYAHGYCYWDLFLDKGIWDVYRNDYYLASISRIVAPGRNKEELPDDEKEKEPSVETNITVDLEVLDWNPVVGEYELEP